MTQQVLTANLLQPGPEATVPSGPQGPVNVSGVHQPVFFYDGDFRTWGEVVLRSRLNKTMIDFAQRPLAR